MLIIARRIHCSQQISSEHVVKHAFLIGVVLQTSQQSLVDTRLKRIRANSGLLKYCGNPRLTSYVGNTVVGRCP